MNIKAEVVARAKQARGLDVRAHAVVRRLQSKVTELNRPKLSWTDTSGLLLTNWPTVKQGEPLVIGWRVVT